ncbi:MAG: hypothetical protein IJ386_06900 [Clostridia bacterium]|nr:hypothetical protein [Clostridia bacterium]
MKKSMIFNYTASELYGILAEGKSLFDGMELTAVALPFGEGDASFDPALYGEGFPTETQLDPEGHYTPDDFDDAEEDDGYRGDWANDPENIAALHSPRGGTDSSFDSPENLLYDIKTHAMKNRSVIEADKLAGLAYLSEDFAAALLFYCGKGEWCDGVQRFEEEFLRSPRAYCEDFIPRFVKSCDFTDEAEWHIAFYAEHKIQEVAPIFPPSFLEIFGDVVEDFCRLSYIEIMAMKHQ